MSEREWSVPGYTELRELGRGGAGVVVLGTHDATGTPVAIKYLSDELRADPEFLVRFRVEARVLGELNTPSVVRLWEYRESAEGAAIVMELVDGVSLRTLLAQQGPTTPESALYVLRGSLLGLAAAHAQGVVHRDYKPDNVLVDGTGVSKLTDFGIALRTGRATDAAGTPSYLAPEGWNGAPAGPAADVYAATATFLECLTGHPPYQGTDPAQLRRQHEHAPIPLDGVPAEVRGLVTHGLAKDPGQRPAGAALFVAELEAVAADAYGPDWAERGRSGLAERAALLALLFPLAEGGASGGTAIATTRLGGRRPPPTGTAPPRSRPGRRTRARVAIGTGVCVLIVGGLLGLGPTRDSAASPVVDSAPTTTSTTPSNTSSSPTPTPGPTTSLRPTTSPRPATAVAPTTSLRPTTSARPTTSVPPRPRDSDSPGGGTPDDAPTSSQRVPDPVPGDDDTCVDCVPGPDPVPGDGDTCVDCVPGPDPVPGDGDTCVDCVPEPDPVPGDGDTCVDCVPEPDPVEPVPGDGGVCGVKARCPDAAPVTNPRPLPHELISPSSTPVLR